MAAKLKRNAILVSGLALLFAWAFQFAKHGPSLRSIIPFGDDPYDAIGSFAFITVLLLALISLARAFLPRFAGRSGAPIYVLRAQAAIVFCILVTVAADLVAMGRHPSMWLGAAGQDTLLILLGVLTASSLIILLVLRPNQTPGMPSRYAYAGGVWLASLLVLWVYPEKMIIGLVGHLFTIVVGDLLLFVPVAMLVKAWLPSTDDTESHRGARERRHIRYLPIASAGAVGLAVGAAAFLGEMSEGAGGQPLPRLLLVAAVFLGLGMVGLLIGYALLGRLLGFVADGPRPFEQS